MPVDRRQRRLALASAGRGRRIRLHDEAGRLSIIASHVGELRRLALILAAEFGLRIGRAQMRVVAPLLPAEIALAVVAWRGRLVRSVLGA